MSSVVSLERRMQSQDERGLHTRTPGKGRVDEKKEVRQGTAGGSVRRRTANPRVPCARPGVSRLTAATERGGGRRREIQTRGRTWSRAARPRAGRTVSGRAVLSPRVGAGAALGGRSGGRGTPAPDTVPLRGQSSRPWLARVVSSLLPAFGAPWRGNAGGPGGPLQFSGYRRLPGLLSATRGRDGRLKGPGG